jgi:tetrahydromethanopterin S-methyltransferase subunit G
MPVLDNPRWERFAQCLVASLSDKPEGKNTFKAAYIAAGYSARGHSAEELASRLLRKVEPIAARVKELQAQQLARIQPKLDISKETIGRRLRRASIMAEEDRNPAAMATCELGMAKVFHRLDTPDTTQVDFNSAQSMQDIGRKLLQSIGFASPDDDSIREAIELNDTFIDGLQQIYQRAQQLTLEQ